MLSPSTSLRYAQDRLRPQGEVEAGGLRLSLSSLDFAALRSGRAGGRPQTTCMNLLHLGLVSMSVRRQFAGERREMHTIRSARDHSFPGDQPCIDVCIPVTLDAECEFPPLERLSFPLDKSDRDALVIYESAGGNS